jgi:hypothetical protein
MPSSGLCRIKFVETEEKQYQSAVNPPRDSVPCGIVRYASQVLEEAQHSHYTASCYWHSQRVGRTAAEATGGIRGTHLELSSTLKSAKEQMDTAAKVAREAARKSTSSKSNTGSGRTASSRSTQRIWAHLPAKATFPAILRARPKLQSEMVTSLQIETYLLFVRFEALIWNRTPRTS